jgi:hypothetical protein
MNLEEFQQGQKLGIGLEALSLIKLLAEACGNLALSVEKPNEFLISAIDRRGTLNRIPLDRPSPSHGCHAKMPHVSRVF